MQRLVDAAVMVVAMVVPPLGRELLEETVHGSPPLSCALIGDWWICRHVRGPALPHAEPMPRQLLGRPAPSLPKRMSEKWPSGGTGRRSMR